MANKIDYLPKRERIEQLTPLGLVTPHLKKKPKEQQQTNDSAYTLSKIWRLVPAVQSTRVPENVTSFGFCCESIIKHFASHVNNACTLRHEREVFSAYFAEFCHT